MPVQSTDNPLSTEKTPLIPDAPDAEEPFPADVEKGFSKDENEDLPLKDITEDWNFIQKVFYFVYYPTSVWFIIMNEFFERFSFYGLRVLLPNYLTKTKQFNLDQDQALSVISMFSAGCYFTPIIGALIADQWLGKYWTIVLLSLVYCLGGATTAVTAIPVVTSKVGLVGVILGLACIALGTGGIKSSVSAFAADQFQPRKGQTVSRASLISSFFAIFYLSVNAGSTLSVITTPLIRNFFSYAIAFSIPAVLLLVGTFVFAIAKPFYHHVPPGGFILLKAFKCFVAAIRNYSNPRYNHLPSTDFLGRATHVYGPEFIEDLRSAIRIILYLPPILFFFALSDLASAIWIYQANLMNRSFFGSDQISSDQLAFLNPVFIVSMAPLLDRVVYPLVSRFIIKATLLRRMYVGFIFTAVAMAASGVLQLFVEMHPHKIHVAFQVPQYFIMCIGELMIAISSMEFAYQEAPTTMKSMMQAAFLFFISCGDLFDLILINILSPIPIFQEGRRFAAAYRNFVFAAIMLLALVYFFLTTFRYKYKDEREAEAKKNDETLEQAYVDTAANIQAAAQE